MPAVPRILRAQHDLSLPRVDPVPVVARLWWRHLRLTQDADAWALTAAGHPSTLVYWAFLDLPPREDWMRSQDIRGAGQPWAGPDRPLPFDPPYSQLQDVLPRPPHPGFTEL